MDLNKSKKITNKKQFEILVDFMKENPNIAKGMKFAENFVGRQNYNEHWVQITAKLNSQGPPTRTETEWQKIWNDYKLKIKKKLLHNKKESTSTGGGPYNIHHLSHIEEDVADLLNLEKSVNPSGRTFGLSNEDEEHNLIIEICNKNDENVDNNSLPEETNINTTGNTNVKVEARANPTPTSRKRRRLITTETTDYRRQLLEEQKGILNKILSSLKEIERYERKSFHLKEEKFKFLKDLEERKFEFLQENKGQKIEAHIAKEKRKQNELNVQLEKLKCKQQKLNM